MIITNFYVPLPIEHTVNMGKNDILTRQDGWIFLYGHETVYIFEHTCCEKDGD